MEAFERWISPVIDRVLGQRSKLVGYQYSEIIRTLMCVYLCGGSCVEDVTSHLLRHLSHHPLLRSCSSDTILRIMDELKQENTTYTSETGKQYDFNTADELNDLLLDILVSTGQLYRARNTTLTSTTSSLRRSSMTLSSPIRSSRVTAPA